MVCAIGLQGMQATHLWIAMPQCLLTVVESRLATRLLGFVRASSIRKDLGISVRFNHSGDFLKETIDTDSTGMVLVDPPIPLHHNEFGPFKQDNMKCFGFQYLPERLDAASTEGSRCSLFDHVRVIFGRQRRVLHDSDKIEAGTMFVFLVGYIILETWQHNVQFLEDRLNRSRHDAIANPSLDTFAPLTVLRRNFADIEDAIRAAKKNFTFETDHIEFETLFEDNDAKPETTEVQYDHLLEKLKVLSTVLNNEIQLVIGSVTVQVRDSGRHDSTLN
jgi:hypothetical protein